MGRKESVMKSTSEMTKAFLGGLVRLFVFAFVVLVGMGFGVSTTMAQTGAGTLYALLTTLDPECEPGCESAIEVVDIASMTRLRAFSIGHRAGTSLAVSPDQQRLYVVDQMNRAVAIFNAMSGVLIDTVPVGLPRDAVLSADGSTLYVSDDGQLLAIDTATRQVRQSLSTGPDTLLGIALSPDGRVVGAVSTSG